MSEISLFRELQQRRLQMKTRINNKKKSKGSSNFHCKKDKIQVEDVDTQGYVDDHIDERCKASVKHCSKGEDSNDVPLSTSHVDTHPALKKKLHWGKNVDWDDFIIDVTARFDDGKGINAVEQFNKLQQEDNLKDYIDKFEDFRSVLLQNGHVLSEEYVLDSFIRGMKSTIKPFV
ncbi:hypothetical protein RDABS01_038133 [Bienertia sinuspersici]